MGFFKSIAKSVTNTVKAVAKDAVPIAAGVLTGGASLQVLKPTALMERIDKATGLPVSAIANSLNPSGMMGGSEPASVMSPEAASTQQTIAPPMAPAQSSSIYDQITPYLNSFLQASQKSSSDVSPNANTLVSQQAPSAPAPSSNKMMYIIGAVVVAVASFLLLRRKK